ncbi:unnamed protein product [Ostreobium quekettii]|uniref:Protein kinase domain-containing protein n=1 Tax=Ostreobium quekettii TaxID=121088 RepID=A0A8S1IUM6_9CHLO|nr:unnamed protein product [Ostreobium quekettii]|eukprot:evm.model.scf_678.1 EVM.evm.TU.scf_678.1   scf_678:3580-6286(-)
MSGFWNVPGGMQVPDGGAAQEPRTPRVSFDDLPPGWSPRPLRRASVSLDGSPVFCGTPRSSFRRGLRSPRVDASPRLAPSPRIDRDQPRPAEGDLPVAEEADRLVSIPLHRIAEVPRAPTDAEGQILLRTTSAPARAFAPPRYRSESLEGNIIPARPMSPVGEAPKPLEAFSDLFEVHGELGAGTYGRVFKATERASGRQVAVKTIDMAGEACNPRRVQLEVAMLKRLADNKLVARFHGAMEEGRDLHIVMELCSGGDLRDFVAENGPLSESQAAMVMYQVLLVIRELHEANIVHGDVKAANFVIANKLSHQLFKKGMGFLPRGWLKAVDFGCSQHTGKGRIQHKIGTPTHWAPEVFGQTYHLEADLWSTGVMVFELLAGRLPFCTNKEHQRMRTERDILKALMFKEPDFGCDELKGLSPECLDFMKRLLTKNHDSRMTVHQALDHKWMRDHSRAHKGARKEVVESLLRRRSWSVSAAC